MNLQKLINSADPAYLNSSFCEQKDVERLVKNLAGDHLPAVTGEELIDKMGQLRKTYPKQSPLLGRKATYVPTMLLAAGFYVSALFIMGTLGRRSLKFTEIPYLSMSQLPHHFWRYSLAATATTSLGLCLTSHLNKKATMGDFVAELNQKFTAPS